jgi:hypothetical protein
VRGLAFLAALLLTWPALAQSNGVIVRSSIKPEQGAVLGQRIGIFVDVLFPGEMPRPPRVSIAEVPGAQIVRYETQATTINDTVDGKSYVGQRFEFAFYARRGGRFLVPAPAATLLDAAGEPAGQVQGGATALEVAVPPGVDPSQPVIATSSLTLREEWTPTSSGPFKAGDAIVRTVTREAADVPGMAMLDLAYIAPSGVRVYVDPPQSDDRVDRGSLTGRRTDKVTYVFEASGAFALPDVVQPWWDLSAGRLRHATGTGIALTVAAAPTAENTLDRVERWSFVAATALGVVALALWGGRQGLRWRNARRVRWLGSEEKAFRDLVTACRQGAPDQVFRAFTVWRSRLPRAADASGLAERIEPALFGGAPWSPAQAEAFATQAGMLRRKAGPDGRRAVLPPLNPATS